MTPDTIVNKDHMSKEAAYQYSIRGSYCKVMSVKGGEVSIFMSLSIPDDYFIYFFYRGKSEYPIFLCSIT
jgi:hypothetical protein